MTPVAPGTATGGGKVSRPPWELSPDTGPQPVIPGTAETVPEDGDGQLNDDFKGLPRRVRQASIAPQLRGDPASRQRRTAADRSASAGPGQAGGPSPEEIRASMSALQRGLQEGRSKRASGEPPWEQAAAEEETDGA
jgi:hypothetical protein